MTTKAYTIRRTGRPPSAATLAKLKAPSCEKCRHLMVIGRDTSCGKGFTEMRAAACPTFDDVSHERHFIGGGLVGRMVR